MRVAFFFMQMICTTDARVAESTCGVDKKEGLVTEFVDAVKCYMYASLVDLTGHISHSDSCCTNRTISRGKH